MLGNIIVILGSIVNAICLILSIQENNKAAAFGWLTALLWSIASLTSSALH